MSAIKNVKTRIRIFLTKALGKSLSEIPETIISESTFFSFDIFDTLILRTVKIPSDVFDLVGEDLGIDEFKEKRLLAEKSARTIARESGKEDTTLDEIYREYSKLFSISNTECEIIKEAELNRERKVCYANQEIRSFYNRIKNLGKRIVIISDMYLPENIIKEILMNNGFNIDGVEIYISGTLGITKRSGRLFTHVLNEQNIANFPKGVALHIGDNLLSDYIKAKKCGFRAVLYKA